MKINKHISVMKIRLKKIKITKLKIVAGIHATGVTSVQL